MVRATRVTNPLSRALGAGISIGAMAAAFFIVAGPGNAKAQADDVVPTVTAKMTPAS